MEVVSSQIFYKHHMSSTQQHIKGYEIQEQIGEGGFGVIYRAFQPTVEREVAIKVILPQYANEPEFIRDFETEARLVARLEHPHIVPLFDYWRDPDGAYLVMRWLRGGSMADRLKTGVLSLNETIKWLDQIAGALALAHRNGIIHRDIKPGNIVLDEEGNAYLTDFGLAALAGAKQAGDEMVSGSVPYMSPEQLSAMPLTPQSDIYSLGIVLYEMLTGKHPFGDMTNTPITDIASHHLYKPLPNVDTIQEDIQAAANSVIQKATAKLPADRYATAQEMAHEFKRLVNRQKEADLPDPDDAVIINPYKGLHSFEEADANIFFGRDALVRQLLEHLRENNRFHCFLSVVGPSGSGKSSAVLAGLVPALKRGRLSGSEKWYMVEFVPGDHPIQKLEAALLSVATHPPAHLLELLKSDVNSLLWAADILLSAMGADAQLLIVIDQFEEVFTLVEDEAERTHFLNLLQEVVKNPNSRVHVIVTLRADFYHKPLLYEGFGALMQQQTQVVLPLTTEELEQAIISPAKQVGLTVDDDLVEAIITDVREEPGALPLLQYALTEVFERRVGRRLTLDAYRKIGGVTGALARRAEEVYMGLDSAQQEIAHQIFHRLVSLGEGSEDTQRACYLAELASVVPDRAALQSVLDAFGKYRLLTFDQELGTREPMVKIAHEAIIREWERLGTWLNESHDDMRFQRRLTVAASEWVNSARDKSYLLRDTRLLQFENWAATASVALSSVEQEYLNQSIAEHKALEVAEAMRIARESALERSARQRLQILAGVMLVALVVAVLLSLYAFNQRRISQDQRDKAQAQAVIAATAAAASENSAQNARSSALAAAARTALNEDNLDLALILAMDANSIPHSPIQAQRVLFDVAYRPGIRTCFQGHTEPVYKTLYTPDGKLLLSASGDGTIIVWDVQTSTQLHTLAGHTEPIWGLAVSSDGKYAVSGSDDMTVVLWNLETFEKVYRLAGHSDFVRNVIFSPDNRYIFSGSADGIVIQWEVESGNIEHQWSAHSDSITALAVTPDGRQLISGARDETMIVWNLETYEEEHTFALDSTPRSIAISSDGHLLLSGDNNGDVRLWNFDDQTPIHTLRGHQDRVLSVAFSPDYQFALSGSNDATIILWDVNTGQAIRHFMGHGGGVTDVMFDPTAQRFVSGSLDTHVCVWDVNDQSIVQRLTGHTGSVGVAAYSPDGKQAASGGSDTRIILWDLATGRALHQLTGHNNVVTALAFSPDGTKLVSGSLDRSVRLWDVNSGQELAQFRDSSDWITDVDYSPDGTAVVAGTEDGKVLLWDANSYTPLQSLSGHNTHINNVQFSADGIRIFASAANNSLIIWDRQSGDKLYELEGGVFAYNAEQDTLLTSVGTDGLTLWDAPTGQIIRRFSRQGDLIQSIALSPDGQTALYSTGSVITVWDINSGQDIRQFTGHSDTVFSLAFSPDGRTALSAGDNSIIQWQSPSLPFLIEWVKKNRYLRDYTCDERELYGVPPYCGTELQ